MKDLVINFAPTGMIPTKNNTPNVPVEPSEIIEQVHEANEIGITMVHLHARDKGIPTYKRSIYAKIFEGIRKHCPDLILCASLSGRKFPDIAQRTEVLELKPDMGSLILSSLNFYQQESINSPETIIALIRKMNDYGVTPELEAFDVGMINYANYLIKKHILKKPYYFNLLIGNISNAQANPMQIQMMINELPQHSYWSLAGIGDCQLKVNTFAIAFGGGVRVGIEDNIWFDEARTISAKNINLIKRIHEMAKIFNRKIMLPFNLGTTGFYNTTRKRYDSNTEI